MVDGHVKVSSTKTKIDNRNLPKTLADMVADDHNNSKNDVQSIEMETNNKKSFQRQAMATSNSSDILDSSMLVSSQEANNDGKIKDLIITEKGKLKWRGDLIMLQLFLDETLNIKGNWTTASGAKTLKNDKVTIRWYCQNESLTTIGGSDAEKVKLYLESRATANYKGETLEVDSNTRLKQDECKKPIDLHNDSIKINSMSLNDYTWEPVNNNLDQDQLLIDL